MKQLEGPEIKVKYRIRNNRFVAFFVDHIIESGSRKQMMRELLKIAIDKFGKRVRLKTNKVL